MSKEAIDTMPMAKVIRMGAEESVKKQRKEWKERTGNDNPPDVSVRMWRKSYIKFASGICRLYGDFINSYPVIDEVSLKRIRPEGNGESTSG